MCLFFRDYIKLDVINVRVLEKQNLCSFVVCDAIDSIEPLLHSRFESSPVFVCPTRQRGFVNVGEGENGEDIVDVERGRRRRRRDEAASMFVRDR